MIQFKLTLHKNKILLHKTIWNISGISQVPNAEVINDLVMILIIRKYIYIEI